MIIALTGYKQSGKSVASKYLQEKYNFIPHNFKDGLIKELKNNFPDYLKKESEHHACTIDELFERKPGSIRDFMKNYAVECRRRIAPHYWVHKWMNPLMGTMSEKRLIVVDDCRFLNDSKGIKHFDGIIIRIKKAGQVNTDTHQTESEIDSIPADYTIEAIQGDHAKIHSDLDKIIQTLKI